MKCLSILETLLQVVSREGKKTHVNAGGEETILSEPDPAAGEPLLKKLAEGRGDNPEVGSGELEVGEGVRVRREGGLVEVGDGL